MKQIPIDKMYIRLKDKKIRIEKHPYYTSLKKNKPKKFIKFMKNYNSYQRNKKSGTWPGFIKLVKSIRKKGFIYTDENPIMLSKKKDRWIVTHGRHRACILYFLYGNYAFFQLKKIETKYTIISVKK